MSSPPPGFTDVIVREDDTYVLAPSLHHAASAAVLRAGFDSHTDAQAFGVNLMSGRSRRARWIVDGVRAGQSLGALLGYWIERELHEAEKDEIVDDVRAAFPAPIVPDPDNPEAAAAALEAIAARNVVDGLALYKAATGSGDVPCDPGAERGRGGVDRSGAEDRARSGGPRRRRRRFRPRGERPPTGRRKPDARRAGGRHAGARRVVAEPLRRHHISSQRRRPDVQRRRSASDGGIGRRFRLEPLPSARPARAAGGGVGGAAARTTLSVADSLQRRRSRRADVRRRRDRPLRARRRVRAGRA